MQVKEEGLKLHRGFISDGPSKLELDVACDDITFEVILDNSLKFNMCPRQVG